MPRRCSVVQVQINTSEHRKYRKMRLINCSSDTLCVRRDDESEYSVVVVEIANIFIFRTLDCLFPFKCQLLDNIAVLT